MGPQDIEHAKVIRVEPSEHVNQISHRVIGAAIEVHKLLGPGFLESVYEEALAVEFGIRGISFARQVPVAVQYKGQAVGQARLDFLVEGCLIVELKAIELLIPLHEAQVISYLRATRLPLGLLINFNVPVLRDGIRRIVQS
jgi:GxxExxY protein